MKIYIILFTLVYSHLLFPMLEQDKKRIKQEQGKKRTSVQTPQKSRSNELRLPHQGLPKSTTSPHQKRPSLSWQDYNGN